MDERTLIALKASIAKWENHLLSKDRPMFGRSDCLLCDLFHWNSNGDVEEEDCCKGCPVMDETGRKFCNDSPYSAVVDAVKHFESGKKLKLAIKRQLDFLRSLLPEEPTDA